MYYSYCGEQHTVQVPYTQGLGLHSLILLKQVNPVQPGAQTQLNPFKRS